MNNFQILSAKLIFNAILICMKHQTDPDSGNTIGSGTLRTSNFRIEKEHINIACFYENFRHQVSVINQFKEKFQALVEFLSFCSIYPAWEAKYITSIENQSCWFVILKSLNNSDQLICT